MKTDTKNSRPKKRTAFPSPLWFGDRRHWRLSDLLKYEAALSGLAEPNLPEPVAERFLTARQVASRYNVSFMWIERALRAEGDDDPLPGELGAPSPEAA